MSRLYYYYLGYHPWISDPKAGDYYGLPQGCVGSVDLRTVPDQAVTADPRTPSFFACIERLGSDYIALNTDAGDCREIAATGAMLDAWEAITGYRPSGDRLVDLLWDQLTVGADPSGESACKPLVPTVAGMLELHLGGHSRVRAERFVWGKHPHTARLRDLIQRDFRRLWEESQRGQSQRERDHPRKVLDYWCVRYRLDKRQWQEFVPDDLRRHVPGPLPHDTTVSDNFNRPDSTDLGPDWIEVKGDWKILSNAVRLYTYLAPMFCRHSTALSSSDQYGVIWRAYDTDWAGPTPRFSGGSSDYTGYTASAQQYTYNTTGYFYKFVSGTKTRLDSYGNWGTSTEMGLKVVVNGSTLEVYNRKPSDTDWTLKASMTDTSISSGLYAAFYGEHHGGISIPYVDDFEAGDLAAGAVYDETGSGGLVTAGGASPRVILSATAAGSLAVAGKAIPQVTASEAGSGALSLSGLGYSTLVILAAPSGDAAMAGAATVSATYAALPAGGVELAGKGSVGVAWTEQAGGPVVLAGAGAVSATYTAPVLGGVIIAGAASESWAPTVTGGLSGKITVRPALSASVSAKRVLRASVTCRPALRAHLEVLAP